MGCLTAARTVGAALLVCAAMAAPAAGGASRAAGLPPVDLASFHGQGELAFLWGDRHPYLLDGIKGRLLALPAAGTVSQLAWSPDGRWLAYRDAGPSDRLWLVAASGAGHSVIGLPARLDGYQWLGDGETLVVTSAATRGRASAWLVTPAGPVRRLLLPGASGLVSPDSSEMAWTTNLPATDPLNRGDVLFTARQGGSPVRRLSAPLAGIWLTGWWPDGRGLLYFIDPQHSNSLADDGLTLYSLPLGGRPMPLATLLTRADWRVPSPSGRDLLLVAGNDREVWHNKYLLICAVETGSCSALPRRAGTVALDPAWSPDGSRIAFVAARDLGLNGCCATPVLTSWLAGRTLWVADRYGLNPRQLAAVGHGVSSPRWSGDGRHLLYWRANALWLIDTRGGQPVRVLGPFPGPTEGFGFYGFNPPPSELAWSRH